jgi:hypothetical protein
MIDKQAPSPAISWDYLKYILLLECEVRSLRAVADDYLTLTGDYNHELGKSHIFKIVPPKTPDWNG